ELELLEYLLHPPVELGAHAVPLVGAVEIDPGDPVLDFETDGFLFGTRIGLRRHGHDGGSSLGKAIMLSPIAIQIAMDNSNRYQFSDARPAPEFPRLRAAAGGQRDRGRALVAARADGVAPVGRVAAASCRGQSRRHRERDRPPARDRAGQHGAAAQAPRRADRPRPDRRQVAGPRADRHRCRPPRRGAPGGRDLRGRAPRPRPPRTSRPSAAGARSALALKRGTVPLFPRGAKKRDSPSFRVGADGAAKIGTVPLFPLWRQARRPPTPIGELGVGRELVSEAVVHPVPREWAETALIDAAAYEAKYRRSVEDPEAF